MDILSILGLIVGFGGIIGGNLLEGGHISALLNLPAIIIVASGAFGAVMLQTPMPTFLRGLKMMAWVFMPPPVRIDEAIQKIIEWSQIARKEGLLGLEAIAEDEPHPFAKKGLQLVVDGGEPDDIREILEVELLRRVFRIFSTQQSFCSKHCPKIVGQQQTVASQTCTWISKILA